MEDNTLLRIVSVDDIEYSYTVKETKLLRGIIREYNVMTDSSINTIELYCSIVRDVVKNVTGMRKIILYVYYPPDPFGQLRGSTGGSPALHDERRIVNKDGEILFEHPRKVYKGYDIDYTFFKVKLTNFNHLVEL